jgi:hypothetical protein
LAQLNELAFVVFNGVEKFRLCLWQELDDHREPKRLVISCLI